MAKGRVEAAANQHTKRGQGNAPLAPRHFIGFARYATRSHTPEALK